VAVSLLLPLKLAIDTSERLRSLTAGDFDSDPIRTEPGVQAVAAD
jgi:hypothetical protein